MDTVDLKLKMYSDAHTAWHYSIQFYSVDEVITHYHNIQSHPDESGLPFVSGSSQVTFLCCFREFFLAIITSGLLLRDKSTSMSIFL